MDGAIELHRLAVEDPAQLERRKEEIMVAIVNATCSFKRCKSSLRSWINSVFPECFQSIVAM